ncbi:hypothetical protein Hs30E_16330 [Lactococcus hodotermopsidis]|uniref:Uncharacterized protein n=1 Tax=Pseudolactococcus hodotermopsidis TaxID=2709157 RepID=A0A6A0BCI5_9LACT|nr:hypothetical protein [Lactococcus hodotermopsidis]GFH43082.1 hypothetical protein Hs30E_16330 [Lactococcus hodotermopsidis]
MLLKNLLVFVLLASVLAISRHFFEKVITNLVIKPNLNVNKKFRFLFYLIWIILLALVFDVTKIVSFLVGVILVGLGFVLIDKWVIALD